jgi:hypothetical protein
LEDDVHELQLLRDNDLGGLGSMPKLDFRGFEVKTIKLILDEKVAVSAKR